MSSIKCGYIKVTVPDDGIFYIQTDGFIPLSSTELIKKDRTNFDLRPRVVSVEKEGHKKDVDNLVKTFPVKFEESLNVFALVEHGWLPPPLALSDVYLCDRNVISSFEQVQSGRKSDDYSSVCWWFSFFDSAGDNVFIEMSSVFSALEGEFRKIPTFEEFDDLLNRSNEIISSQLKKVTLTDLSSSYKKGIYDFFFNGNYNREMDFLLSVVPKITRSVSKLNRRLVLDEIIEKARLFGLKPFSHVLVLSISCLFESPTSNFKFARKILKPSLNYTREDGHNCLSDIIFINLLLLHKYFVNKSSVAVTSDLALAYYWSTVTPIVSYDCESFSYMLKISDSVFEDANTDDFSYIMDVMSDL